MKAIVAHKYGPANQLRLEEVDKPEPGEHEVLVKVKATAINDWDWSLVRGRPYAYRLFMGIYKPKFRIPGVDVAGIVESVGVNVSKFKPGDAVYGDLSESGFGAFAEYVCAPEKALTPKSHFMTFQEAASLPHAATLAMQSLINIGKIKPEQRVLINGAGGGVGTLGGQIAKGCGAHVTGVDSAEKLDMMKSMGYDEVIDYRAVDFTKNGQCYDIIVDAKTTRSPFSYTRALSPNGIYVSIGGQLSKLLQILLWKKWIAKFQNKNLTVLSLKPNENLSFINGLFQDGKMKCVIEEKHGLEAIPSALQFFGEAKHKGKVVISL